MNVSLAELSIGKKVKITALKGGIEFQRKIASLNIRVGKEIEIVTAQPFAGPIIIRVNNRKITLGRGLALKIIAEAIE